MGIIKILRSTIIFIFTFSIISCKQNVEKDKVIQTLNVIKQVEKKQEIVKVENQVSQKKAIDFLKKFYVLYLTDINEDTNRCKLGYYLTEDLIESIDKSDGYPIIDSQDYEKIDLNTLKVSKTNIENVFKVSFINYKERVLNVKLVPVGNSFKIVSITIFRKNINFTYPSTVTKPGTIDAYDFDLLSYVTDSAGDRTQVSFFLEDFSNGFVFTKGSYDENFEYRCIKKKTGKDLKLYYQEDSDYDKYTGDTSIPLITIYKKGEDFYAVSSLIENGKEVKLKEVESRY